MERSDRLQLRRVASGDAKALAALYDRQAPLVALRLRHSGASVEETEDILQETFVAVWESAGGYRGESAVAAWIWGIARRRFNMMIRSEIRFRDRQQRATTKQESFSAESGMVDGMMTEDAFSSLNPDFQEAFRAVVVEGLKIAEAADRLGVPEGTVKSRVHRARQIMQKELK
jgi:RNA polymerase sigma-70 factor (ECF subfamily)